MKRLILILALLWAPSLALGQTLDVSVLLGKDSTTGLDNGIVVEFDDAGSAVLRLKVKDADTVLRPFLVVTPGTQPNLVIGTPTEATLTLDSATRSLAWQASVDADGFTGALLDLEGNPTSDGYSYDAVGAVFATHPGNASDYGIIRAISARTFHHDDGDVAEADVISAYLENTAGGRIAWAAGAQSYVANSGAGTMFQAAAFAGSLINTGGLIDEAHGLWLFGNTGSITTNYGIRIDDQTAGGTNYSIYGGAGLYHFGDDTEILGSLTISGDGSGSFGGFPAVLAVSADATDTWHFALTDTDSSTTGLFYFQNNRFFYGLDSGPNVVAMDATGVYLGENSLGTGAVAGPTLQVPNNVSGSGAAGTLQTWTRGGTPYFIWFDATGAPRFGTAAPTEDNSVSDTSGSLFGLAFKTFSVSGQSDVVADSAADTLTVVAGANVTITTNAGTDTITIAASGGSGSPGGSDTQCQFNDAGSFGGDAGCTYNKTTDALTLAGTVGAGGYFQGITATKTSGYTAGAADSIIPCDASGGAVTITLPAVSGLAGRSYTMIKVDSSANACTLDGNSSELISGNTTVSTTIQWTSYSVVANNGGTAWYIY